MPVNPALHIALSHLCHPTEPRTLWIDALCINQEDLKEREEQVGQMRLVYNSARRVLVWLGEEDQNSGAAMSLIANIGGVDLKKLQHNSAFPRRAEWNALFALLQRPWWNRVWIIQEVTVGKSDPFVGCGNQWVPWSKFEELDQILGELEEIGAKVVEGIENPISRLRIIRAGTQGRLKTSWRNLFLLLRATNGCQTTDARDKVFALLGLSSEKDQSVIRPDYTKSAVEIYTAVAKHLIRSEESLNVLMYFKPSELPGLPSWVPDFNLSSASRTYVGETPGKGASADSKPVVDFLNDSKIKARGWILDEVQETSQEEYDAENPGISVSNFEKLARKTLSEVPTMKEEESLSEAFWRCLVADRTLNYEFPAPDSYGHLYSVFCGKVSVPDDFEHEISDSGARKDTYLHPLTSSMLSNLYKARFFITREGRLGFGPLDTRKGDLIVVLQGADVPFVVRECDNDGVYTILREAYVSGLMFGEMFERQSSLSFDRGYRDLVIC
ncbi:uncharacterized protein K444DRAFT_617389 [Hyaloscypha bicolor E]|uniref:Heterokaryon incompatibility domain-containing protein n=1 Tax=Hyaloscypha bicolor E TaxID=1095630 RepID=A0A2J6SVZ8_9HELO|nr:uncharacterized protein K444DRAFT_617389 [Hyaloscypha bicolor E]PMD54939.1 hypothetical protein K444DRAFT_617389 [Hyaloscypha bicolor E]